MKLALFGYGGHAKEVSLQINEDITFFVDDEYSNETALPISKFDPQEYKIMIAVADSYQRKSIVERLPENTKYFTFIHPTSIILGNDVEIGDGSFIGAYCIITTNIKIGAHSILNRGNQIGHDCIIGNYFSAMPGSIVSGNVNVGECVYLGTNASTKQKLKISDNVVVGMNAAVVKDIFEPGTYVGVPARKVK